MAEGPSDMAEFLRLAKSPLVKATDMSPDLKEEALDLCLTAVEKSPADMEEVTQMIKEAMEKKFDGHWHVVAGQSFAFDVTHETYLYVFVAGTMAVLLWKS